MVLPSFFNTVMSGDNYLVAVDFIITGDKESQTARPMLSVLNSCHAISFVEARKKGRKDFTVSLSSDSGAYHRQVSFTIVSNVWALVEMIRAGELFHDTFCPIIFHRLWST